MKCIHCNSEVAEGTNYCPYCGKPIGVPQSLKCPQCNLDVPEGTEFCPNCGSPIGTSISIVCHKCGTELQKGDKFCYNCGEPVNIVNWQQSKYGQRGKQDVSDKVVSKAEGLILQSKKFINEKVQPQFDEKVNEFKKVDWEDKKKESVTFIKGFFSNTEKLRMATICIAIIAVLWFFIFNHGFSAKWTWWLFALAFVVSAFYKVEAKDEADALKKARWTFGLAIFLGFVLIFNSPNNGSFDDFDEDSSVDYKAKNDDELRTLAEMAKIYGEIKNTLPQVEQLYNAHRLHMANGLPQTTSPAWGRWQDLNHKINRLWDDYIRLAGKLDDSENLIEEAKEKRRIMNKAFDDMFVPQF